MAGPYKLKGLAVSLFCCLRIKQNFICQCLFNVYLITVPIHHFLDPGCHPTITVLLHSRDLSKGHILVRTGDHDNKVDDEFEQEFALEHLISHSLYDGLY